VGHRTATRDAVSDGARLEREEREVPAEADVLSRMDLSADLPNEDCSGVDILAAEDLHSASLTIGVATIPRTALSFFM